MEASYMSIDGWMNKRYYRYTMEYYSAIKMNKMLPFATMWMDLEGITFSEISQTIIVWYYLHIECKKLNKKCI